MLSMVVYVVLFFLFATFAIMMSTNINYKTLAEKGNIWVNEQSAKLEYNLIKSAKSSTRADYINNIIAFSNNDEYTYDKKSKRVLKNGGVVAMDVESFSIIDTSILKNAPESLLLDEDDIDNICIEINLKKYGIEKKVQYYITVGDDGKIE